MKRIGATLLFLITAATTALNTPAATITSQLLDPWGRSNTVSLTWKLKGSYAVPPNVTYTDIRAFVATNGTFSASIGAGNYDVQVGPRADLYAVTVPTGSGSYDLSTLITNAITFPYTASPQYVQKAGDVMAGNLSFASSSYGGFILNSLTTAQRLALTPTNGMIVYDATISSPFIYTSGGWSNALTAFAPSLWLSDTNAFASGIALRSLATGDTNAFANSLLRRTDTNGFASGVAALSLPLGSTNFSQISSNAIFAPPPSISGGARALQLLEYSNAPVRGLFAGDSMSDLDNTSDPSTSFRIVQNLRAEYGDAGVVLNSFDFSYGTAGIWNGTRPEDPKYYCGNASAIIYASDGTNAARSSQLLTLRGSSTPVNSIGFYWQQWPKGGTISILHTNSLIGSEVFTVSGLNASGTNVAYTNWPCKLSSDNTLLITSVSGTNVILGGEYVNVNKRGFLGIPYARGGSPLVGTLAPGTNAIATLFKAMNPDFAIWHAKDYSEEDNITLSNDLVLVMTYSQAARGTNTSVFIVGTPPNTDPGSGDTSIQQNIIERNIANDHASLGWFYVDLFSSYPGFQAMEAAGVMGPGGPHPVGDAGANNWAYQMERLMGLNQAAVYGYNGDVLGMSTNGPIPLHLVGGVSTPPPPISVPTPTLWMDAGLGITTVNATNKVGWWQDQGSSGILFSATGRPWWSPTSANGRPSVLQDASESSYFFNGTITRDMLVDTTNHTDTTILVVASTSTTADAGAFEQIWHAADATSTGLYEVDIPNVAQGNIKFFCGTNSVLTLPQSTVANYGAFNVWRFTRQGNTMTCALNGTVLGTTNVSGAMGAVSGGMSLGTFFNGQFPEILTWNRSLSAVDLYNAETQLIQKYQSITNVPLAVNAGQGITLSTVWPATTIAAIGNGQGLTNLYDVSITKTTNYTATAADSVILVNAATKVITLPTAVGIAGRCYTVKLIASGTTGSVATTSSQNIDASSTYSLSAQYKYVKVISDGTQWWIVGNN